MDMRVISGSLGGRQLRSLNGGNTRPTTGKVREAIFSSIQAIVPASTWLDLFAGSGSIGIEALSRGASFCWFVDKYPPACKTIESNIRQLGLQPRQARVLCLDAVAACKRISLAGGNCIDIVYLDPPYYKEDLYQEAIAAVQTVLKPGGYIIIEHGRGFIPVVSYALNLKTKQYGMTVISYFRNGGF